MLQSCAQVLCLLIQIWGQSDAVGHGAMPAPAYVNASQIFAYSQPWSNWWCRAVNDANGPGGGVPGYGVLAQAVEPVSNEPAMPAGGVCNVPNGFYPGAGTGFGIALANEIIAKYKAANDPRAATMQVILVPSAQGGTNSFAYGWEPNYDVSASSFGVAVARAKASEKAVGVKTSLIVVYQGVSDAIGYQTAITSPCSSASLTYPSGVLRKYAGYPYDWVTDWFGIIQAARYQLGNNSIPFVLPRLWNPFGTSEACYPKMQSLQNYADVMVSAPGQSGQMPAYVGGWQLSAVDQNLAIVRADDLNGNNANIPQHLGRESLATFGMRAGDAAYAMLNP